MYVHVSIPLVVLNMHLDSLDRHTHARSLRFYGHPLCRSEFSDDTYIPEELLFAHLHLVTVNLVSLYFPFRIRLILSQT